MNVCDVVIKLTYPKNALGSLSRYEMKSGDSRRSAAGDYGKRE